jgi:peptide/nickel transport system permease protein/oligopeptide transport system permease protein
LYRFLLSRAIGLVIVIFGVTFLTFIFGYFAPGDPIRTMMGLHLDPLLYSTLKHTYGLDLPWWQQYYNYVVNAMHGQFGLSFYYPERYALDVLKDGMPYTIELGLEALATTLLIGIPAGVFSAVRANTHADTAMTTVMMLLYCIPDFVFIVFFQVVMIWLYQNSLPSLPIVGWDSWQSRIGPVLVISTTGAGYFARLTRTTVLETLGQEFVKTARGKGLRERAVLWVHVLRYCCIPLLTVIGPSLAFIVTGDFIAEAFFNIPGVGYNTLVAISVRDYPVLQASTILFSTSVVVFNALTDVAYAVADPRIRVE